MQNRKTANFWPFFYDFGGVLHDLEDIKAQVFGLGDVPQDGVIGALLTGFDLAEGDACILGGVVWVWKVMDTSLLYTKLSK